LGYQLYFEGCEYDTLQNVSDCVYSFDLPEGEYDFGVQAVYSDGQSDIVEVSTTDAEETELVLTPGSHKVYPNPFNPEVTISFSSTEDTENTEINIYNIKGQQVKSFKIQNSVFQIEKVVWDGRDDRGNQVSSGVYFIKLQIGKEIITNKVIMLK
jgi:flagellar hook assembly protein FlgD